MLHMYADVTQLGSSCSINVVTGKGEVIAPIDLLICGFSCKDLSSLKNQQLSIQPGVVLTQMIWIDTLRLPNWIFWDASR